MIPDKIDILHFLYTPFTGLGRPDYRGDLWLKNRIEIFKQYTLRAVLSQTNNNFIHWISFRPQEKDNPIIWQLEKHLRGIRNYRFIFTFEGICFWDDKYPNDNLKMRLKKTLPVLEQWARDHKTSIGQRKYVYMTIQPSDDMYYRDAIEQIQLMDYDYKKAVGYILGYILNANTGQLAEYNPTTIPPFYTLMFLSQDFFNPQKHYNLIKNLKSHEQLLWRNFKPFNEKGYCVLVHGENISTTWDIQYKGREMKEKEKSKILLDFGMMEAPRKIERKKSKNAFLRKIHNVLPRILQNITKRIYLNVVQKER